MKVYGEMINTDGKYAIVWDDGTYTEINMEEAEETGKWVKTDQVKWDVSDGV